MIHKLPLLRYLSSHKDLTETIIKRYRSIDVRLEHPNSSARQIVPRFIQRPPHSA
jgi:hypothetical protein